MLNKPVLDKTNGLSCAPSKINKTSSESDQPSLCSQCAHDLWFPNTDSEDSDQSLLGKHGIFHVY